MAIHPQEAGMEVMSILFVMLFVFLVLLCRLIYGVTRMPNLHQEKPLKDMLQAYVKSTNRNSKQVESIHHILMTQFAQVPEFETLLIATGSFIPGGQPPFMDEDILARKFSEFLATRYDIYLDPGRSKTVVQPSLPQK